MSRDFLPCARTHRKQVITRAFSPSRLPLKGLRYVHDSQLVFVRGYMHMPCTQDTYKQVHTCIYLQHTMIALLGNQFALLVAITILILLPFKHRTFVFASACSLRWKKLVVCRRVLNI